MISSRKLIHELMESIIIDTGFSKMNSDDAITGFAILNHALWHIYNPDKARPGNEASMIEEVQ